MDAGAIVQGRYQLHHLLGEGGFGQVWKAVDRTLDRGVAVTFATSLADDPQAGARFTDEARRLARMRHAVPCAPSGARRFWKVQRVTAGGSFPHRV